MAHTAECIARAQAQSAARAAWIAQWPNHCEECDGWGGRSVAYDPSPAGVGLSPGYMEDFDPCEECVGKTLCPRCGERLTSAPGALQDSDPVCRICGWDAADPDGAPPPIEGDCGCCPEEDPFRDLDPSEDLTVSA